MASISELDVRLRDALAAVGVVEFFRVQRAVVPAVLCGRDVLVRAATGSGKTLAYAIPIIQTILQTPPPPPPPPPPPSTATTGCVWLRARALVVVATRDVAEQIARVFESIAPEGIVTIATSATKARMNSSEMASISTADVVVATPGRLCDLLAGSASLEHLRFLVVDEADRTLDDGGGEWVAHVLRSAHSGCTGRVDSGTGDVVARTCRLPPPRARARSRTLAPLVFPAEAFVDAGDVPSLCSGNAPRLQKLLFSATLVESARKLVRLHLDSPWRYDGGSDSGGSGDQLNNDDGDGGDSALMEISQEAERDGEEEEGYEEPTTANLTEKRYLLPENLTELFLVCETPDKLLTFGCVLERFAKAGSSVLCFCSSVRMSHEAAEFARSWFDEAGTTSEGSSGKEIVAEYSMVLGQRQRDAVLEGFRSGKVRVLVTTDVLARGIDLPNVDVVVNVSAPRHVRTYVHRAGRTARAGKPGTCVTLAFPKEVTMLQTLAAQADGSNLCRLELKKQELARIMPMCQKALDHSKKATHPRKTATMAKQHQQKAPKRKSSQMPSKATIPMKRQRRDEKQ
jgi:ATP-dependent RNA helicase DDX51/DBP6